MPRRADRRRFLKNAAARIAAVTASAALVPRSLRAQTRSSETVIVVGAGAAGLAAAYRLRPSVGKVIVLEARAEAGGRARTVRTPFADSLYGEAGASRISEAHAFTLGWANELGLTVVPFAASAGAALSVIRGARIRANDSDGLRAATLELKPDERGLTPGILLNRLAGDTLGDVGETGPDAATYDRWKIYDRETWPAWLHARGASEDAVALMTLGGDPKEMSALYVLRQIALNGGSRRYYTIQGGMDRLPKALAAGLSDNVKYNVAVMAIDHAPDKVHVSILENGRTETLSADRLVLAIPFTTLRRVALRPPFSGEKMTAIETLAYYPATRFLFQTRRRFWQAQGLSGAARSDFAMETWDASAGQNGTRGILSATVGGRMDDTLTRLDLPARARAGRAMVSQAFPDADGEVETETMQRWSDDPWARGAFAAFAPGQMTSLMPAIGRAEGRVHFAGEHTSPWTGWIEGALRSGERVAQEIMHA